MSVTETQLHAVLSAASDLLGARQDHMLGLDEWVALAKAVAACSGAKPADLLTERDLADIAERAAVDWDPAVDGTLPDLG